MATIKLPDQLLAKVRETAAREAISPEALVQGAVEARLSRAEWARTLAFADRNALGCNLKPEDAEAEISAARSEHGR
jgi:predicted transcriptional regulator